MKRFFASLPDEFELSVPGKMFVTSDQKYSEVERMITVYERKGIEKGIQQGKQEDLIVLLEKKFGKLSAPLRRKIRRIESPERLESLLLAVLDADSLEDLSF